MAPTLDREPENRPVLIIMGSVSDWPQMKAAATELRARGIKYYVRIVSAHRTPNRMAAALMNAKHNGFKVVIAGAGGSAHLPGMSASETPLPVLGVAIKSSSGDYNTQAAIGSCIAMPPGVPLFFMGVGEAGARNAALGAMRILALSDERAETNLDGFIKSQTTSVPEVPDKDFDMDDAYPDEWS